MILVFSWREYKIVWKIDKGKREKTSRRKVSFGENPFKFQRWILKFQDKDSIDSLTPWPLETLNP
jgi:hypothetical protein